MRPHVSGVPHAPGPLARRMAALGLDVVAVARSEPDIFRELGSLCAKCRSLDRCERDLHAAAAGPMRYCRNSGLLNFLTEIWWLRKLL